MTYFCSPASANYPTSELSVAAPEPSTIVLLGAGLFGMLGLRRRPNKRLHPGDSRLGALLSFDRYRQWGGKHLSGGVISPPTRRSKAVLVDKI